MHRLYSMMPLMVLQQLRATISYRATISRLPVLSFWGAKARAVY